MKLIRFVAVFYYCFYVCPLLAKSIDTVAITNTFDNTATKIGVSQIKPIKSVELKALAENSEWLALLYFPKNSLFRANVSQIDDKSFFLALDGKTSPLHELQATFDGIFAPADLADNHILCKFPARVDYILRNIKISESLLPKPNCNAYIKWQKEHSAQQLTLLFPSAYINSPASMFGHLFLRLERKDQAKTPILMSSVNFGAITPKDFNTAEYLYKGLTGGYPGRYSIVPYYVKVKEYVDEENRDIWEYPIKFTPEEVAQFNRHLWEVRDFYYDYFFLDENCAYRIITLLEAIRPTLNVSGLYHVRAAPADLVYELNHAGLLEKPTYRPSALETFYFHLNMLSSQNKKLLAKLLNISPIALNDTLMNVSDIDKAAVLEVLDEFSQIKVHSAKKVDPVVTKRLIKALTARSKLTNIAPLPKPEMPLTSPDQGHFPSELQLSIGQQSNNYRYMDMSWHSVNHAISNPLMGYYSGNELIVGEATARLSSQKMHNQIENHIQLQQADLLRIIAMRAANPFFQPLSWQVRLGGNRCINLINNDAIQPWQTRLEGGIGYSLGTTYNAAAWQTHLGAFAMGKLQDTSCYPLNEGGIGQYAQVFPRVQLLVQNNHFSLQYKASLEEQGHLLTQESKVAWNKNTKWSMGIKYQRSQIIAGSIGNPANSEVSLFWSYYLH